MTLDCAPGQGWPRLAHGHTTGQFHLETVPDTALPPSNLRPDVKMGKQITLAHTLATFGTILERRLLMSLILNIGTTNPIVCDYQPHDVDGCHELIANISMLKG